MHGRVVRDLAPSDQVNVRWSSLLKKQDGELDKHMDDEILLVVGPKHEASEGGPAISCADGSRSTAVSDVMRTSLKTCDLDAGVHIPVRSRCTRQVSTKVRELTS